MKVWAIITAKILTYSKLQIYNTSHSGKEKFSPWSRSFSVASFSRKRVRLFGRRTFFRISVFQKNWGSSNKNLKRRKKTKRSILVVDSVARSDATVPTTRVRIRQWTISYSFTKASAFLMTLWRVSYEEEQFGILTNSRATKESNRQILT